MSEQTTAEQAQRVQYYLLSLSDAERQVLRRELTQSAAPRPEVSDDLVERALEAEFKAGFEACRKHFLIGNGPNTQGIVDSEWNARAAIAALNR